MSMPMEIITEELEGAGFLWREKNNVRVLVCAPLEAEGFVNAFSTRTGGVSPMPQHALNLAGFHDDSAENIAENRRRLLQLLNGEWSLMTAVQVHGDVVHIVRDTGSSVADSERADALATNVPKILLGVKTADCVPVILGDEKTGALAAIHAGWRGTLAGIVGKAIRILEREYGVKAKNLRAAIGPAALACCYEVGSEVIDAFTKNLGDAEHLLTRTREGHALIDLHRANRDQLLFTGLEPSRIHTATLCTMCRTDLFFSYRREKQSAGCVGRLLSVIGGVDRQSNEF